jgi:protein-disulfide isomerase-like protein with CxxC motif
MRKIPKVIYQTADQIDARIKDREVDAARLPQGEQRQSILKEIAQLRMYAEAKRWTQSPALKAMT